VPRYNGAGEANAVLVVDVVRELHRSVEGPDGQRLINDLLNDQTLLVFPLLLQRSDQRPALHHLGGPVLSELVQDGGVTEGKLVSYLLQIQPRVLPLLFVLGVLPKNLVHRRQFLPGNGGSDLSIFFLSFSLRCRRARRKLHLLAYASVTLGIVPLFLL
jgi:hypothetical protein